jgi:hypothetical protein
VTTTPEQQPSELAAPDPTLSSDANDSTYAEAEVPETNPPSGSHVEQTLGKPGAGAEKSGDAHTGGGRQSRRTSSSES